MFSRRERFLSLCCVVVLCICSVGGLSAHPQEIYIADSQLYQEVELFCQINGVTGPSTITPVSGSQLLQALSRVDEGRLSDEDLAWKRNLETRIMDGDSPLWSNASGSFVALEVPLNVEMYAQTSEHGAESISRDWVLNDWNNRKSLAAARLEVGVSENIFGKIVMETKGAGSKMGWNDRFSTNFQLSLSRSVPYEAAMSIGNGYVSFMLGRDRLSYGNGYTGNLFIGDNFPYQEFLKLAFYSEVYEGSLSLTLFDQQREFSDWSNIADYDRLEANNRFFDMSSSRFSGMKQVRLATSHSFTICDVFTATLNLGTMVQTDGLDFRLLNPFMYFHNMNNFSDNTIFEANNFASVEISYSFLPGWRVSAQAIVDQLQLSGEVESFEEQGILEPNAWGVLANGSWTGRVGGGVMSVYIEGVYTSPALYLNEKYITEDGHVWFSDESIFHGPKVITWNQDLIVGYYRTGEDGMADLSYSGYVHGPDSAVAEIGLSYSIPNFSVDGKAFYRAHGEKGIPYWTNQDATFDGLMGIDNYNKWSFVGEVVEHTLGISLECNWAPCPGVSLYGGVGFVSKWNHQNIEGRDWSGMQFAFGVGISPVAFTKFLMR